MVFLISQEYKISIHAPSRERPYTLYNVYNPQDFNPRSLAGATTGRRDRGKNLLFQSTLPRGSD